MSSGGGSRRLMTPDCRRRRRVVVAAQRATDDQHDRGRDDDQQHRSEDPRGPARWLAIAARPSMRSEIVGGRLRREAGGRAQRAALCETAQTRSRSSRSSRGRIGGARDRPRGGNEDRGRVRSRRPAPGRRRCRPEPRPPGVRKIDAGISSRSRAEVARLGRADDRAHAAEPAFAGERAGPARQRARRAARAAGPRRARGRGRRRLPDSRCGRGRTGPPRTAGAASTSGSSASPPISGFTVAASAPRPSTSPHGVSIEPNSACA